MAWTVIEADGNGVRETRSGGTLTGETEAEAGLKPERRPLVAVRSLPPDYTPPQFPWQVLKPDAASDQRAEPEPEPEPKPKLVTWRLCNTHGFWFPSNKIPKGWVALESQTLPVETIKQLPEGQKP
jgi:hypothetical protein